MVVVPGHFTEVAGTQLEKVPAVVGVFSHLNGPLPPPGFAGEQVSPHVLSSHGQTRVKQVLGRLCVCVCVCVCSATLTSRNTSTSLEVSSMP